MKKIILVSIFALVLVLSGISTASARTPVGECSGSGLIFTIDDSKVNDFGSNAYDDGVEVYCRNGVARFCLTNEACPWRSDITSADNMVCSPSGINRNSDNARNYIGGYPNMFKMAELRNKSDASAGWRNSTEYWCSSDGKNKDIYPPYDYDNDYEPPTNPPQSTSLYVSCSADDSYVETDERVRWTAFASGGTGSYQYDWSGSEGLNGSGSSVSIEYDRDGTKNATVRVTSGSRTASASCGSVHVDDDRDRDDDDDDYYNDRPSVYCYPDLNYTTTDNRIIWRAYASGGNGRYSYSWSGTDSLRGSSEVITRQYDRSGVKSASVTVRSDGRSSSASCGTVNIIGGNYQSYLPTYQNNVTASCSANVSSTRVGSAVVWSVYPFGGNGVYTYSWSGSEGFSGSQKSVATSYRNTGPKYATVSVYSGGKTTTISCGTVNISAKTTAKPVVKKPIVKPDTTVVDTTPDPTDFNAYGNVPWMFVMIIVIAVLFVTVMYLLISKK